MAAPGGISGLVPLLVCRVGQKACGLSLPHVIETMRALPIEPLADMPELTLGLSLIRGRPTPVLDGHRLLGGHFEASARRFVTLRVGPTRAVALAVDEVLGVRRVAQGELDELPALTRASARDPVSSLGTLDRELLVVLEHARLLSEADWQRLEAATT